MTTGCFLRHPEFISGSRFLLDRISYLLKMQTSYTYILSNSTRTMLYIGVTSILIKRIQEHKAGKGSIFTQKYHLKFLMYFEEFTAIEQAIAREKQLKNWRKEWKWNLIKEMNPDLMDLYEKM